jgi:hypothetical protein
MKVIAAFAISAALVLGIVFLIKPTTPPAGSSASPLTEAEAAPTATPKKDAGPPATKPALDPLLPEPEEFPAAKPDEPSILRVSGQADANPSIVDPGKDAAGVRVREGTRWVDRPGVFRPSGSRWSFVPDGGKPVLLLENLLLEQVEALHNTRPDRRFAVTGQLTEFKRQNFLLVERISAAREAEPPPAPGEVTPGKAAPTTSPTGAASPSLRRSTGD